MLNKIRTEMHLLRWLYVLPMLMLLLRELAVSSHALCFGCNLYLLNSRPKFMKLNSKK